MNKWRFAARLARRDLGGSLRGLRLLFVCIFLGVATLAAIGSLAAALTGEIRTRGQTILGGDVEVEMNQRRASAAEREAMRALGQVSETVRLRSMARAPDGDAAVLSELKAVDGAYPLYGRLMIDGRARGAPGPGDIFVSADLADRLGVARGGTLRYGEADFRVAGVIGDEPDRLGEGFTLGPVAIVSLGGLARTRLEQPGSLTTARYRLRLAPTASPGQAIERLREQFPDASWELKARDRAASGLGRFFERMGQFLTLTGLAALIIAGIGAGNGIASYLRTKRGGIATLKMLGANSGDIGRIYLLEVGAVALAAIAAGLAVGAVLPPLAVAAAGDILPVRPGFALHPLPLATSAAYGVLMAFAFALTPLARARLLPVAALFREDVGGSHRAGSGATLAVIAAIAAIVALAVTTSDRPWFALSIIGAAAAVLALLAAIGAAVVRIARRLPRPRRPLLRLALAGLHRPGAATVSLVVALGLALTLFVTLAAIQSSLAGEIARTVPQRAPDQFVLDVPAEERGRFERTVAAAAPGAEVDFVPTLRGAIVALNGRTPSAQERQDKRFLFGERGVTYSATLPEGSTIASGRWWPSDYRGPPLVSLDADAADALGLKVGDRLTVSVLGRPIEAAIASTRTIEWSNGGFNYILVFPPSALESAPHNLAASVKSDVAGSRAVARAVVRQFPSASVIDVGEVIGRVGTILRQMSAAILLAASVAVMAGIAVLTGAIAASREARTYDSVIMKTLGATRRQILATQAIEYALLAAVVGALALALGLGGAWYVIVRLFEFTWQPDWALVLATLAGGTLLTLAIALLGSLPVLGARPAAALRTL